MKIGITGATGFIGCRLAERLILTGGCEVVAPVRRFSGPGLARLARLPVRLVHADLLDSSAMSSVLDGCDVVVHCAYGTGGSEEERHRVTVEGTENVLRAARAGGARRLIHLSTAAIHEAGPGAAEVDESAPIMKGTTPYERAKVAAEAVVWRCQREHGLPVVVFRPPLVYGPYGRRWTVRIVQEIAAGVILVDGGSGVANLVYVDNLVDAILLAIESDAGDGEAFIVVDDERLTWRDTYEAYARLLPSAPPLQPMTVREIEVMRRKLEPGWMVRSVVHPFRLLPRLVRAALRPPGIRRELKRIPWLRGALALPKPVLDRLKAPEPGEEPSARAEAGRAAYPPPSPDVVRLCASRTRFCGEKVKRVLGHSQAIDFERALERTADWLQYQRLIPGTTRPRTDEHREARRR